MHVHIISASHSLCGSVDRFSSAKNFFCRDRFRRLLLRLGVVGLRAVRRARRRLRVARHGARQQVQLGPLAGLRVCRTQLIL